MGMHNGTFLLPFKKSLSVYKNTGLGTLLVGMSGIT